MKRNKNKRIWNDLLLAACLLLLCIFLACGGFGMLKPAQAESSPFSLSAFIRPPYS